MCANSCNKMASISSDESVVKADAGNKITGFKCPKTIGIFVMADFNSITFFVTPAFEASCFNCSFQYSPASEPACVLICKRFVNLLTGLLISVL